MRSLSRQFRKNMFERSSLWIGGRPPADPQPGGMRAPNRADPRSCPIVSTRRGRLHNGHLRDPAGTTGKRTYEHNMMENSALFSRFRIVRFPSWFFTREKAGEASSSVGQRPKCETVVKRWHVGVGECGKGGNELNSSRIHRFAICVFVAIFSEAFLRLSRDVGGRCASISVEGGSTNLLRNRPDLGDFGQILAPFHRCWPEGSFLRDIVWPPRQPVQPIGCGGQSVGGLSVWRSDKTLA